MNCVICDEITPEGRQVCKACELIGPKELVSNPSIKIVIPAIPPSNNKYMGRGSKYVQQVQYQSEKQQWAWYIRSFAKYQGKPIEKAVVKITYYFKDKRRRDPDNYAGKFILDGLVDAGILVDDSFNNIELVLRGKWDKKKPRTEIEIKEQ